MMAEGHQPVLVREAVAALALRADGWYLDATFGRGGHSRAILAHLGPQGRLWALDRDPEAVAVGEQLAAKDPRFAIYHAPFSRLGEVLTSLGVAAIDGVLFDFGVSSPQLDTPERGMSFRFDGPLDMRMDPTSGEPVSAWLARADCDEIAEVIKNYGEERFAYAIAKAIIAARTRAPLVTTGQLAEVVARAVPRREPGQHPATRTFQALRIWVNQELAEIDAALPQAAERLQSGGRLVAISFHSLEDRRVKRFLRGLCEPQPLPPGVAIPERDRPIPPFRWAVRKEVPTAAEVAVNPRARSAILRAAERR
jgi:16S rRNA (cytosine1402-N4)-methyltransferase